MARRRSELRSIITMPDNILADFYRCPNEFGQFSVAEPLSVLPRFFHFGPDTLCYGRYASDDDNGNSNHAAYDAMDYTAVRGENPYLPFDPMEVISSLRCELYVAGTHDEHWFSTGRKLIRKIYYSLRPLMPVGIRRHLQRITLRDWQQLPFPSWPVDRTADRIQEKLLVLSMKARGVDRVPFIWFWPEGYSSCAIVTHDVEEEKGLRFCPQLMDLDEEAGVKASFQIVPETRYANYGSALERMRQRGFEVNVHDLNHDGQLYEERGEFLRRAEKINRCARDFGAAGFRSGALYRKAEWYDAFEFSYDMSIPNVARLDPQRGGCCTVMPYFIGKILELPVTATQDYTLFHIFQQYAITLWIRQLEIIRLNHGLANFIVHPDYLMEDRALGTYRALLAHLSTLRIESNMWIALPGDVDRWWRQRSKMALIRRNGQWEIDGEGKERARLAYAMRDCDRLRYTISDTVSASVA